MATVKYIECIKGFLLGDKNDGIEGCVMVGEIFEFDKDGDGTDFIALEGNNRCPGMEVSFSYEELAQNFKIIPSYIFPKTK